MDYKIFHEQMIITSSSINPPSDELCNFIIDKLGISQSALELGVKRSTLENSPFLKTASFFLSP